MSSILPASDPARPLTSEQGSAALASELGADNLKIIGVDVDQYVKDPKNQSVYLTTVEKGMDASVLSAIEMAKKDIFAGGLYVGTLANNGVRIAPYHDLSSDHVYRQIL